MSPAVIVAARSRTPITALLGGHAASLTGNVMTLFVVPLYVLSTGGSVAEIGIAGFCATLPVVVGGALGGVLVDRIGYRITSIFADLIGGVAIAAIPIVHWIWGLPLWLLLVLVFTGGLFDTPAQTARNALVPEMAELAR